MSKKFKEDDLVLLIDRKKRRHLIRLSKGKDFHSHSGILAHGQILGQEEGAEITSSKGSIFTAFSPTLMDYVLEMERGPQIIYPKDLGPILLWADIYPGVKVFESGVGSGALSLALLRAGAEITGYEIRKEHIDRALENVIGFLGKEIVREKYEVYQKDCYEGIHDLEGDQKFDRAILDLPEPWEAISAVSSSLASGGILLAYTPSITQAMRLTDALLLNKESFYLPQTMEILNRPWHIEGSAVRPEHRMVAHTGFLTRALKRS